jgi:hypothetical protein
MLEMTQSNPPIKPTAPEQNKPAAMPAAPQPAQQPTNQPKPPTVQPTDRAGEKTTP